MSLAVNGSYKQGREQIKADHAARQRQLDDQESNYRRKTDDATAKTDKAIDNAVDAAKSKGRKAAQKVNGLFDQARVETRRSGDYGQMGTFEILGDIAKRGAGTVSNGVVEAGRIGARGVYKAGKTVAKADLAIKSTTAKVANHAFNGAKSMAHSVGTGVAKAANTVSTKAQLAANKVAAGIAYIGQTISGIASGAAEM